MTIFRWETAPYKSVEHTQVCDADGVRLYCSRVGATKFFRCSINGNPLAGCAHPNIDEAKRHAEAEHARLGIPPKRGEGLMMTDKGKAVVNAILDAFASAVEAAGPQGVPGGTLYVAAMEYGLTLESFESIMAKLVKDGRVVKRGQLYFMAQ